MTHISKETDDEEWFTKKIFVPSLHDLLLKSICKDKVCSNLPLRIHIKFK